MDLGLMARVTTAHCLARIEAMQEEIDALRAIISPTTWRRGPNVEPPAISEPIDFKMLNTGLAQDYSYYDEASDVYRGGYI